MQGSSQQALGGSSSSAGSGSFSKLVECMSVPRCAYRVSNLDHVKPPDVAVCQGMQAAA
jgi:hypothetical protein